MKKYFGLLIITILVVALPALAQRQNEGNGNQGQRGNEQRGQTQVNNQRGEEPPRANGGRIPAPPPQRPTSAKPDTQREPGGRANNMPHVANNHWYGHDRPDDKRYHIDDPFEHGHWEHFGPDYRYHVIREDFDHRYVWLPGGYFQVSEWDWPICQNWCWNCGDDFVVYQDLDHPGWYLLYNIHTGQYVHAIYMGQ